MRSRNANFSRRTFRLALSASLVAVAALGLSGDALAHGKHRVQKHAHHPAHRAPMLVAPAPVRPAFVIRPVIVPQRIVIRTARDYSPYRYATVWAPEHRHRHALYRFPVATPYGVAYQTHAYCDGIRVGVLAAPPVRDDRPHGFVTFGDERIRFGIGF